MGGELPDGRKGSAVDEIADRHRHDLRIGQRDRRGRLRRRELGGHSDEIAGQQDAKQVPAAIGEHPELGQPARFEHMEAGTAALGPVAPVDRRALREEGSGPPR